MLRVKLVVASGFLMLLLLAGTADAAVKFTANAVPVSGQTLDVAVGDVDGANGPDLVASVSQGGTGSLAVRLNTGNGTFAPETLYPLGCLAEQVELTDLGGTNNDNRPDGALDAVVFCIDGNGGQIGRIAGDGAGAFPGPAVFPPALVAGTGDGLGTEGGFQRLALAQVRQAGSPLTPFWTYYYNAGWQMPHYVSTICTTYDWQQLTCYSPVDGYPNMYPPVTGGVVADARVFGTGVPGNPGVEDARRLVALGDFPGAGAPAGTSITGVELDFGPSPGEQLPAWKSIAIGDLAHDGPDIVTAQGVCGCIGSPPAPAAGRVSVLPGDSDRGQGHGVQPDTVPLTTQSVPGVLSIEVGDVDGDGNRDVIGTSHTDSGNALFVHVGDGNGGLAAPVTMPLGGGASYSRAPIILSDVDRNGSPDAVVITDGIQVLKNGSTPVVPVGPTGPGGAPLRPFTGISGLAKSAKVDKKGFLNLGRAKNPPTSSVDLSVAIPGGKGKGGNAGATLRAKSTVIGHAKITVPAGGEAALRVRLKSKAKKKLRSGGLKATLTLVAVATDGTKDTKAQALKIKPAKK